jgi:leader peptidase (prepilin peptidase)/N-methyltransferase
VDSLALDLPPPLAAAWATLVGAVVGSFLNVVIARVPRGESVVSPRSRCPRCGAAIAWYDNIPVLSWVLLRARCRACGAPISWRYPLVEALGGAAGLLAASRHGLGGAFAAELTFAAALVALAFIDLDTWLLPHALTWPLIAFGLAASALGFSPAPLGPSLLGAALGFASFAAVAVVGEKVFKKEALGFGDVWLLAGIGAFVAAKALLPVVLLASLQGSVVGIALLLSGRGTPGPTPNPAAPDPPPSAPIPAAPSLPAAAESAAPAGTVPQPAALERDWVPPRHALPFGPFLALGALEWLYLADALGRIVPALRLFR